MRLSDTFRLLQYGQASPHTPNLVEDALRLRMVPGELLAGADGGRA